MCKVIWSQVGALAPDLYTHSRSKQVAQTHLRPVALLPTVHLRSPDSEAMLVTYWKENEIWMEYWNKHGRDAVGGAVTLLWGNVALLWPCAILVHVLPFWRKLQHDLSFPTPTHHWERENTIP